MKKIFVILLFLTMTLGTTTGQPYKSIFGQSQTSWNVAFHTMPDWVETDSLVVSFDTLINGKYYKTVNGQHWFDGFIREDTMTGRIWYLFSYGSDEILVMDLSLNVGDTFIVNHQLYLDSIAIVDSIKYEGGNKILILSSNNYNLVLGTDDHFRFIEGVGPDIGVIFQQYQSTAFGGEGTLLLCAHKDFFQTYTNTSPYFNGQCYVLLGGIEENQPENSMLTLFPNPTRDKIQIEYHGQTPYCLEIIDYTGKIIDSREKINLLNYEFDLTNYSKGFYLIKAYGANRLLSVGKIMKF